MHRSKLFAALATLLLTPACAGSSDSAIADSDVDAIATARSSLTTVDEFATPDVLHVRLAWGYLAWQDRGGRTAARTAGRELGFDWTGNLVLSDGTATLDMSTFLEKGDSAVSGEANEVKWNSHTYPHFDGVIATLKPASAAANLVIKTPSFEKTLSFAEVAAGKELRFDVESTGRQFSISALPDESAACSGFVVGFVKPEGAVTHFKGLRLSNLGDRLGKLRFEASDGVISSAEVLNAAGEVVDTGAGTLDAAAHTFSVTLGSGTVSGLYADPSYSSRGSFQATARCP